MADNEKAPTHPKYELYAKLHRITDEIGFIQKDKKNDFHKYMYASEEAIKRAFHEKFVQEGILFNFSVDGAQVNDSADGYLTTIHCTFSFTDIVTGESINGKFCGQGSDKGDKGIYKAITGAIKYCLTSNFLIPTGDDPEKDEKMIAAAKAAVRPPIAPIEPLIRKPAESARDAATAIFDEETPSDLAIGASRNGLVLAISSPSAKNPNVKYWRKQGTNEWHSWFRDNPSGELDFKEQK